MKALLLSILLMGFGTSFSQVVTGLRPPENAKEGEFTAWQKQEVTWDDGSKAEIEYRIAFTGRKGIACHYVVEVKNNSTMKLDIKVKSVYYDKLVKGNQSEESKDTVKPGKTGSFKALAQGCKKEKGVEKDDYGHCFACEFGVNIHVYSK